MPSSGRSTSRSSRSNVTFAGPPHFGSKLTSHGPEISGSGRNSSQFSYRRSLAACVSIVPEGTTNTEPLGSSRSGRLVQSPFISYAAAGTVRPVSGHHRLGAFASYAERADRFNLVRFRVGNKINVGLARAFVDVVASSART